VDTRDFALNLRDVARFRSKVDRSGECWLWQGSTNQFGYAVFWLAGRQVRAARVALFLDGRVPNDHRSFALHHCDNPACVRPTHLYWGTHTENMADRANRGRTARGDRMPHQRVHGEAHPKSKLTEDDVREIRRTYRPGLGGELMRRFGISQPTLWNVVNGKSWRHVT
jgi:hypothetical protein